MSEDCSVTTMAKRKPKKVQPRQQQQQQQRSDDSDQEPPTKRQKLSQVSSAAQLSASPVTASLEPLLAEPTAQRSRDLAVPVSKKPRTRHEKFPQARHSLSNSRSIVASRPRSLPTKRRVASYPGSQADDPSID